jgi:drug/metabolite transporter (DMT)-like permease
LTLPKNATHRALLFMFASATMFGAMAFSAKIAAARLSGPEVAMVRMAFGLLPVLLVPRWLRAATTVQRVDLVVIRGFFGGVAVMLYFMAIQHTSVGVATLLNYTSPIWSGIMSVLFLRERFSARALVPLPIAFLGIFLVVHAHAGPGEVLGFGRWELAGILSAVSGGAAITAIRAARRTESSWAVYASFCLLGMLVNAPLALLHWQRPRADEWAALAATGFLAMGAQLLMTFSLRWLDAMTTGVISQLAVIVSFILGAVFLNDHITAAAALGSALTIGGVIGVMYATSLAKAVPVA